MTLLYHYVFEIIRSTYDKSILKESEEKHEHVKLFPANMYCLTRLKIGTQPEGNIMYTFSKGSVHLALSVRMINTFL